MSQFDKRIKVNTIIENQLPEFILADFPNATEFFKQYYISQEFQGGSTDLISNFDQYLKVDNLVPEVVVGVTSISTAISSTDTTITVPSTKGFPSEYGLLKVDDEIISYTGITSTSFTATSSFPFLSPSPSTSLPLSKLPTRSLNAWLRLFNEATIST